MKLKFGQVKTSRFPRISIDFSLQGCWQGITLGGAEANGEATIDRSRRLACCAMSMATVFSLPYDTDMMALQGNKRDFLIQAKFF